MSMFNKNKNQIKDHFHIQLTERIIIQLVLSLSTRYINSGHAYST